MSQLEKKLINNQKDDHVIALRKINNLFQNLYFNGDIQERSASYIPYYMKFGPLFFDVLIKKLDPLEKDYIILKGFYKSVIKPSKSSPMRPRTWENFGFGGI